MKGLDEIRNRFRSRYPLAQFPTLSSVLEKLISKDLERFDRKPSELAKVVEEFKQKYPKGTTPAVVVEDNSVMQEDEAQS